MEYLKALVLGIVQGVTEWLPISSTAHLLIVDDLIRLNGSSDFKDLFLVLVQLGSILAVVVLYFNELFPFKHDRVERNRSFSLWLKIIVASIPAAILGLVISIDNMGNCRGSCTLWHPLYCLGEKRFCPKKSEV